MMGYAAADVMNKITPADISDPQEVIARAKGLSAELGTPITPGFEALVFKASRDIEDIYELTYIRKDGSRFPAVVSVTALRDDEGAIIGYLLIATDNTARKQAEEVLRNGQVYTRSLVEADIDALMATERLGQLIDDMLLLSRVTRCRMHVEETDMSAPAAEVAERLVQENPQRDAQLSIEPRMTATGDRQLLHIVLGNLLGNAWKFTSKHEHAHVSMGTERDPEHGLAFFVRDDGAGFDLRYKDKLFVAFQRLHSREEFPGTGIGPATVERVVRRHGGRVWPNAQVGQGTTFHFTLGGAS
jgi:signal transduction histidine kinase